MVRLLKLTGIIFMFFLACVNSNLSAEDTSKGQEESRFVLIMINKGELKNAIIPTIVLDSYRGVVWICHNLQDARSPWIKTDLGQNGDKLMTTKRYSAKLLEVKNADTTPAIVSDNDEGIIWICPNIVDSKAIWMKRDFKMDFPVEQKTDKN